MASPGAGLALRPAPAFDNPRSEFLSFQLERCDYFGVDATRMIRRDFSQRDVDDIDRQIEQHVRRSLPREIARLNLSAARLLVDLGEKESERINRYLLNYCAAMGDAYASEGKHPDVTRAFYAEAFYLASSWEQRLDTTLNKYIMSYFDSAVNLLNTSTGVQHTMVRALSREGVAVRVVPALLQVSLLNVYLTNYLIEKVVHDRGPELIDKVVRRCQEFLGVPPEQMDR
ncbi:MAG TPA: hypothetical protein VFR37_19940, partial [Longimicrobium sp.]|nr:hypothetical protein [Longimicrobium sp.]